MEGSLFLHYSHLRDSEKSLYELLKFQSANRTRRKTHFQRATNILIRAQYECILWIVSCVAASVWIENPFVLGWLLVVMVVRMAWLFAAASSRQFQFHSSLDLGGLAAFLGLLVQVEEYHKFQRVECGTFPEFPTSWGVFDLHPCAHPYDSRDRVLDYWDLTADQQKHATSLIHASELKTNLVTRQVYAETCYKTANADLRRIPLRVAGKWGLLSLFGLDLGISAALSLAYSAAKNIRKRIEARTYETKVPDLLDLAGLLEFVRMLADLQRKEYFSHLSDRFLPFPQCWVELLHFGSFSQAYEHSRREDSAAEANFRRRRFIAVITVVLSMTVGISVVAIRHWPTILSYKHGQLRGSNVTFSESVVGLVAKRNSLSECEVELWCDR